MHCPSGSLDPRLASIPPEELEFGKWTFAIASRRIWVGMHRQPEHFTCVVKSLSNAFLLRGAANVVSRLWLVWAVDLVTKFHSWQCNDNCLTTRDHI